MSAAPEGDANASKAGNENNATDKAEEVKKPAGTMDGDDEWEEFPAQGMQTSQSLSWMYANRLCRLA